MARLQLRTSLLMRSVWTAGLWAATGLAQAQTTTDDSMSTDSPYVMSYVVVVIAIGLGLMAVCRVSRRGLWQIRGPRLDDHQ